ncbi:Endo-1,3(4)-beta-glucanase 2 [Wickerhamomyces ciferrii]|uniref:glucan endo-1,3-beta-D-glucosidase n=1 Tax=Wickerhamomyces ciferrii (strain ATCC 14091 / BCRC 22168 / CBS 111 / JCM 3599 / NBRC 0793 / NRRL Y-1031 F-60-10) TaxID=1206466 RepID=K0KFI1_WICCF|nr:Endo-1,3(4)-beta-glucanase 2 [Wickerhamomyces ciferrii]CCH41691.1 Endo-1,3(4)-beta-glucanase 2 [Wickerhamomyces ciferrii]
MYDRAPMPIPGQAGGGAPQLPPRQQQDQQQGQQQNQPPPIPPKRHSKINNFISRFKKMSTQSQSQSQQQPFGSNSGPIYAKDDLFGQPISTNEPLSQFQKKEHDIKPPVDNDNKPVGTNKFYTNLLLENQNNPIWTQPYSIWFSKDDDYHGFAVHQVQKSSIVTGDATANAVRFFFGPLGIKSFVFGSTDFDDTPSLSLQNIKHLSAEAKLKSKSQGDLVFPVVQGQGFVTGVYNNLIPKLSSSVGFRSFQGDTSPRSGINKYKIELNDDSKWVLYVTIPDGQSLELGQKDGNHIEGNNSVNGAIFQLAKGDSGTYDEAAGAYQTGANITNGSVSDKKGNYSLKYDVSGESNSGNGLIFALPHHVDTLTSELDGAKTDLKLDTITKGTATAYLTNELKFSVDIPSNIGLDPYSSIEGASLSYSDDVLNKIKNAANSDVDEDVEKKSDLDSMYYAGKALAKYALVLYVTHYVIKDDGLTEKLLPKLKKAIERFSKNEQQYPLAYDTTWKGLVSTADRDGDFGNAYYNDHHFHYGYHVFASAIAAKIDGEKGGNWIDSVKDFINDLARDYATPTDDDQYFPAFRAFDWYNGHSWAKGVFASGDGKDQESTSEDYNAYYALKLWGDVVGDENLKNRSDIILGVLKHSINSYFLLADDNKNQPKDFIANKVTGILFENKVDYTTYFGTNTEYIHGIQVIPVTSVSSFIRGPKFTKEEWDQKLKDIAPNVEGGWRGLVYLDAAFFDPDTAWNFFSADNFNKEYLDGGLSLTWSLTYSGAFANK